MLTCPETGLHCDYLYAGTGHVIYETDFVLVAHYDIEERCYVLMDPAELSGETLYCDCSEECDAPLLRPDQYRVRDRRIVIPDETLMEMRL